VKHSSFGKGGKIQQKTQEGRGRERANSTKLEGAEKGHGGHVEAGISGGPGYALTSRGTDKRPSSRGEHDRERNRPIEKDRKTTRGALGW